MIQAVSSIKTVTPKTNLKYVSNVSFKSNPLSLVKDEVMLSTKVSKMAEEAAESIGKKVRGLKDEMPVSKKSVTAAGVEDVVDTLTDGVPVGGVIRTVNGIRKGDAKSIVKGGASIVDNTVLVPTKLAAAAAVAAKGAAIGTMICPGIGTAVGSAVGFLGTLFAWGKVRNAVVDEFMD